LIEGVAAWMDGHISRMYDGGDHVILVVRPHTVHRNECKPLLYHSGSMFDWADAVGAQPA
jgi:flavin reductase (DIM6/NTAB) family NADH-FMN oxidoreductase RutF